MRSAVLIRSLLLVDAMNDDIFREVDQVLEADHALKYFGSRIDTQVEAFVTKYPQIGAECCQVP